MPTRKVLKARIHKFYRTQDRYAYAVGIDSGILSRIINCTKNPTDDQMKDFVHYLDMTEMEVNTKYEY